MVTRTIQITIDEQLLAEVDAATRETDDSRSAFIRAALEEALQRIRIRRLEKQHAEAYARTPQTDDEIQIWANAQDWSDS